MESISPELVKTDLIKPREKVVYDGHPLDRLSPNPVMLAPMVGLTHYAVRQGVADFLPDPKRALWPTEMLNSRRVPSQHPNDSPEVCFADMDNGLYPQLLANEEEFIRMSVRRLEGWGVKALDINMGCPVNKALKHNYGVALMGDPVYAREVVATTVKYATVPVSVKLRAGLETYDEKYLFNFVDGLFESGASWITLHPRTAEQKRRGKPNWNLIKNLKLRHPDRRIIGNGDVQCHEEIVEAFELTGCDRVMIGRALMVKPWLIRHEPEPDAHTQGEWYGQFLKAVLKYCREQYEESAGMRRLRFLQRQGKPWVEFGEYLQGRLQAAQNYEEMSTALDKFFAQKQKIIKKTELRT
ncbi:MAG: tRNA-dihydrouridine synthase family protein [Bdellovibrionales bacterium]|nr:tRNA-dihydrouridine synthase family protein [Bdellovibrionales bacterium]